MTAAQSKQNPQDLGGIKLAFFPEKGRNFSRTVNWSLMFWCEKKVKDMFSYLGWFDDDNSPLTGLGLGRNPTVVVEITQDGPVQRNPDVIPEIQQLPEGSSKLVESLVGFLFCFFERAVSAYQPQSETLQCSCWRDAQCLNAFRSIYSRLKLAGLLCLFFFCLSTNKRWSKKQLTEMLLIWASAEIF